MNIEHSPQFILATAVDIFAVPMQMHTTSNPLEILTALAAMVDIQQPEHVITAAKDILVHQINTRRVDTNAIPTRFAELVEIVAISEPALVITTAKDLLILKAPPQTDIAFWFPEFVNIVKRVIKPYAEKAAVI